MDDKYCTRCGCRMHSLECIKIGTWDDFASPDGAKPFCLDGSLCGPIGHEPRCSAFGEIHGSDVHPDGSKPYLTPDATLCCTRCGFGSSEHHGKCVALGPWRDRRDPTEADQAGCAVCGFLVGHDAIGYAGHGSCSHFGEVFGSAELPSGIRAQFVRVAVIQWECVPEHCPMTRDGIAHATDCEWHGKGVR